MQRHRHERGLGGVSGDGLQERRPAEVRLPVLHFPLLRHVHWQRADFEELQSELQEVLLPLQDLVLQRHC